MDKKLNRTQLSMFTVLLFLAVIFSFGIGTVAAADQSQIYVNPLGNDSWDGQYETWQNTTFGPKLTVKNATGTVMTNGVVYVANGTYNENNIAISRNMSIIGESKENTIINGTNTGGIFSVTGGATVTFANLTLTNGNTTAGGAIYSSGNSNIIVKNSIFQNGLARGSGGGAIYNSGSTFTISDCSFLNNRAAGGTSYAGWGGAIAVVGGTLTVTNSNFISNSVTGVAPRGGAIFNNLGSISVQFSRFIGNTGTTGSAIYSDNYINAPYNWWGSNTGPAAGAISGSGTTSPWLVLTAPTGITLGPNANSIITASLQYDSGILSDPANPWFYYHDPIYEGHVPDGIPVTIANGALGTISPLNGVTLNGLILANFTAGAATGVTNPTFTVDSSGPIPADITIANVIPTQIIVDPVSSFYNDWPTLSATLTNTLNHQAVSDAIVDFYVNNIYVGSGLTDTSGLAIVSYNLLEGAGIYQIIAQFIGNGTYSGTSGTNNLTVDILPTTLVINNPPSEYYNSIYTLSATLTDSVYGYPVSGRTVKFRVNNGPIYVATTDEFGNAYYQYTPTLGANTYQIFAQFLGDNAFTGSSATSNTTLLLTSTNLTVTPKSGYYNNSVALTANLTDTIHGVPLSGKTINFIVNDVSAGSAVTGANGIATYYYTPLTLGTLQYFAQFAGDSGYGASSSNNSTIIVNSTPTAIKINAQSVYNGLTYSITATLYDAIKGLSYLGTPNGPIAGRTVEIFINGTSIGTTTTNSAGVASISYATQLGAGTFPIFAQFAGDTFYNASNGTGNLNVVSTPTVLTASPVSGNYNSTVNLTATLKENVTVTKNPIAGKTINFSVNGVSVGSAITDALGVATLAYNITQGAGIYPILAQFAGDSGYGASSNTKNLTVSIIPTGLVVNAISGYYNDLVNLTATLTDTAHGTPLSGKNVTFTVNNVSAGSAITNASGVVTVPYTIALTAGTYQILAQFAGDLGNNATNGTNNLTVSQTPVILIVNPLTGYSGIPVNLTASLKDMIHNTPISGKTIYFYVNNVSAGSIATDTNGIASLPYNITLNAGTYPILAQFLGDSVFLGSTGSSNLNVVKIVINTRTNNTYNTIQSAIDDSNTLNGDTLTVHSGTYVENVLVNKQLILNAIGLVNVNPFDANLSVFTINSAGSGSTIQGFNISGSNISGITIDNSTGNTIIGNIIDGLLVTGNTSWGINIVNCNGLNNITGNNVTNCVEGINLYNTSGTSITGNNVSSSVYDGIALNLSTNNTITGNVMALNVSGIRLIGGSNNNIISNNNLAGNIWTSVSLVNSDFNQITNNIASGNQEGMYIFGSINNTITGNTANNNIWDGIAIHDSNNNTISNNLNITGNNSGIRIIGTSNGNQVNNNVVNGNLWSNISLDTASNNTIYNNILNSALVGIYLQGSSNNQIYNNTIQNNTWDGIDVLFSSNNNTINNNTIENSYYGERILSSTNNTSYMNNFVNNTVQGFDDSTNAWDNGTTGNYWSDWPSTSPRPIAGGSSVDNHPSTTPF